MSGIEYFAAALAILGALELLSLGASFWSDPHSQIRHLGPLGNKEAWHFSRVNLYAHSPIEARAALRRCRLAECPSRALQALSLNKGIRANMINGDVR
jgi:hypothetical protein